MGNYEIYTRNINGSRSCHYIEVSNAYNYICEQLTDEDEILLVLREGVCIYSSLMAPPITKEELMGFFA